MRDGQCVSMSGVALQWVGRTVVLLLLAEGVGEMPLEDAGWAKIMRRVGMECCLAETASISLGGHPSEVVKNDKCPFPLTQASF